MRTRVSGLPGTTRRRSAKRSAGSKSPTSGRDRRVPVDPLGVSNPVSIFMHRGVPVPYDPTSPVRVAEGDPGEGGSTHGLLLHLLGEEYHGAVATVQRAVMAAPRCTVFFFSTHSKSRNRNRGRRVSLSSPLGGGRRRRRTPSLVGGGSRRCLGPRPKT